MQTLDIRAPSPHEFESWYALYHRYSVIMGDDVTLEIGETMWRWIHDPFHPVEALVACTQANLVGFAHYRPFPRTLHGNDACFLDDLYVSDPHRGVGVAPRLIHTVAMIAKERGWSHVRWVTSEDNIRAQRLYNRIAQRMDILTYRLPPE